MNREGAETYLRVLAESQLRGPMTAARGQLWPGLAGRPAKLAIVSQALIAVHALDEEITADILADLDLAVSVRQRPEPSMPPPPAAAGITAAGITAARPGRVRFARTGPMIRPLARPLAPPPAFSAGAPGPERPRPGAPDRFVPVGLRIPYRDEVLSGEVFLMSFAHTASGARFAMAWRVHSSSGPDPVYPGMVPFGEFTVTDDRSRRYHLDFAGGDGPDWYGEVELRPEPPDDLRWLDISAPGGRSVRVELDPATPAAPADAAEPEVSPLTLSPGEQLLITLAERLLTVTPDLPPDLRRQLAAISPGPLHVMATGLGDVIAALEAADVLSPLSPVPGQLAAVCAGMRVSGHGITVPAAYDLPEPWLSLLAYYQRRRPDATPVPDGCAAVAAALPELDGIRLALLGLLNSDGSSWIRLLARGLVPERRTGPFGIDYYFPLSFWIRDNGGRWHAGRPAGVRQAHGEWAVKLELVPPLARSTTSIEVLAAGSSAQVRVRLPLRWGYPQ
jgi:hypothetical protein